MPIVNYVREHVRFIEYASEENLSASEMLLWYALMHQMNQRAQGNIWPEEFVRIDNDRLLSYLPFGYDTLAEARNKLKQRGVIDYVPGERNRKNPTYKIIYFYPQYVKPETEEDGCYPEISDKKASYPEKSVNFPSNMGGNMGGNKGGNTGGNPANIDINYKDKDKYNRFQEEDEDDVEDHHSARTKDPNPDTLKARKQEAEAGWLQWTGKEITPALAELLVMSAVQYRFEEGVLDTAIQLAALKGDVPKRYIIAVLNDWGLTGIRTSTEAEQYQALKTFAKSSGYGSEDWEELARFRKRMRERKTEEASQSRD